MVRLKGRRASKVSLWVQAGLALSASRRHPEVLRIEFSEWNRSRQEYVLVVGEPSREGALARPNRVAAGLTRGPRAGSVFKRSNSRALVRPGNLTEAECGASMLELFLLAVSDVRSPPPARRREAVQSSWTPRAGRLRLAERWP